MKRKLMPREWMLLGVLAALVVIAGYIMLFYMPTTSARDAALAEAESCRQDTETARVRLEEKLRMEQELEEIFAQNPNPLALADYDNLQPVMVELNTILAGTDTYSLSFATVDTSESIIRREISINYTSDSYNAAKNVLQQLHDSTYRCMLNNIAISGMLDTEGTTTVSGSIVFFECMPEETAGNSKQ